MSFDDASEADVLSAAHSAAVHSAAVHSVPRLDPKLSPRFPATKVAWRLAVLEYTLRGINFWLTTSIVTVPLVSVNNVSKKYCRNLRRSLRYGLQDMVGEIIPWRRASTETLRRDEFWAVRDVSFALRAGEALALLGPNGAGKSTLLKLLTGILRPDSGEIRIQGKVASLIELGTGFNPVLSGRENIYINAAVLGFDRAYVDRLVDQIIDFADIGEFVDAPVMGYSSGMYVRLAYAVAANLEPDVLLVDEVLAVGDAAFRRKCIRHMKSYVENGGSLIVVSHTPPLLEIVCDRSLVLRDGQVDFSGSISEGIDRYFSLLETDAEESGMATRRTPAGSNARAESSTPHGATGRTREPDTIRPAGQDEPVRITSLTIEPDGEPALTTGRPARVTMTYLAHRPLERILWGLVFQSDAQGIDVATEVCRVERLEVGQGKLQARLPRLPFLPGRYTLRSALIAEEGNVPLDWLGWQDQPLRFVVEGSSGLLNTIRKWGGALVSIEMELVDAEDDQG